MGKSAPNSLFSVMLQLILFLQCLVCSLAWDFVFPEMSGSGMSANLVQPAKPKCSSWGKSWCDPSNYPDEKMTELIRQNSSLNQLLQTRSSFPFPDLSYQNVCPVTTNYIKPRAAMNMDGQFMFIVNEPSGSQEYFQVVRVSICANDGQECGEGKIGITGATKCSQQFSEKKLLALSASGQELVIDTFSFPSCCTCMVQTGLEF